MLVALLTALSLAAQLEPLCHHGQHYDGPASRARPSDIVLPVRAGQQTGASFNAEENARLDAAADRIAAYGADWSLSVRRIDGAHWSRSPEGKVFAAASITKSMTAAMIYQLIEEGRLDPDQTLDHWRADLPHADLITLDDLLSHRSGYFLRADGPLGAYAPPEASYQRLHSDGVVFCPGTSWAYSNIGYMLLGDIIAATDGNSFDASLAARILEPLLLSRTRLAQPDHRDPELVAAHVNGEEAATEADYAGPYASGAVLSTAEDLTLWWQALMGGAVVSPASLDHMTHQAWPLFGHEQMGYGRGVQIADFPVGPGPLVMHSGGVTGFVSVVAWLPRHGVFVAAMTNEQTSSAEAALWALVQALNAENPDEAARE